MYVYFFKKKVNGDFYEIKFYLNQFQVCQDCMIFNLVQFGILFNLGFVIKLFYVVYLRVVEIKELYKCNF